MRGVEDATAPAPWIPLPLVHADVKDGAFPPCYRVIWDRVELQGVLTVHWDPPEIEQDVHFATLPVGARPPITLQVGFTSADRFLVFPDGTMITEWGGSDMSLTALSFSALPAPQ